MGFIEEMAGEGIRHVGSSVYAPACAEKRVPATPKGFYSEAQGKRSAALGSWYSEQRSPERATQGPLSSELYSPVRAEYVRNRISQGYALGSGI